MPQQKHASPQSVFKNSSKHSNCCNGATPNLNSSGITPIKIMPDARNTKYNIEDMKVAHLSEHTVRYIKKSKKVQNDFLVRQVISISLSKKVVTVGNLSHCCGNKTFQTGFYFYQPNPNEQDTFVENIVALTWGQLFLDVGSR